MKIKSKFTLLFVIMLCLAIGLGLVQNSFAATKPPMPVLRQVNYANFVQVNIASYEGTKVYYTTDGTEPNSSSQYYTFTLPNSSQVEIRISDSVTTFKAKAFKDGEWSDTATLTITSFVLLKAPTISPNGGVYTLGTTVNVTLNAENADKIYYTTNGGGVTTDSKNVPNGSTIAIKVDYDTYLRAKAYRNGVTGLSDETQVVFSVGNPTPDAPTVDVTSYSDRKDVVMHVNKDETIYYTMDNSEPTLSSQSYTGRYNGDTYTRTVNPLPTYFKAKIYKNGQWSPTRTIYVEGLSEIPAPTVSPSSGSTFSSYLDVYMYTVSGATIYYTTDGSTPYTYNYVYNGPVRISKTTSFKIRAYKDGRYSSTVDATYYINENTTVRTPSISPNSGTYTYYGPQWVYVTLYGDSSDRIYFTTDGSTPIVGYANNIPANTAMSFYINGNTVLKARAYRNGNYSNTASATFYMEPVSNTIPTPSISPYSNTYSYAQNVDVNMWINTNDKVYYTINGTTPSSSNYEGYFYGSSKITLYVNRDITVKARTYRNGSYGDIAQATYYLRNLTVSAPRFNLVSGQNYTSPQTLTITADYGATLEYTTDGSNPAYSSTKSVRYFSSNENSYSFVVSQTQTIGARAYKNGIWSESNYITVNINNGTYLTKPTAYPAGGNYYGAQSVTLTTADPSAVIFYTTDGREPVVGQANTRMYTGEAISITSTTTLMAKAIRGTSSGDLMVEYYVINGYPVPEVLLAPTIAPQGSTYTSPVSVTLWSNQGGEIRYTVDNTLPQTYSILYTGPITVASNMTIRARVFKNGNSSPESVATYVIYNGNPNPYPGTDITSMLQNARTLFDAGKYDATKYDQAISVLNNILSIQPNNEDAILLLADCYEKKSDLNSAKSRLLQFINSYDSSRVVNRYAEICISLGEYNEAKTKLISAIAKYQNETYLYSTLSKALEKLAGTGVVTQGKIYVYVYGKEVNFAQYDNVNPRLYESRTIVPVRAFFNALGAQTEWNASTKTATITLDGKRITLKVDSRIAWINGVAKQLDVPAILDNDRLMVPLRFISENFGKEVNWYSVESVVSVISVTQKR